MSKRKIEFKAWLPALGIVVEALGYNGDIVYLDAGDFYEYIDGKFYYSDGDLYPKGYMEDGYEGSDERLMEVLEGEDVIFIEDKYFELLPSTGMFYTGTENPIFEGDLVTNGHDFPATKIIGVVKYMPETARCWLVQLNGDRESLSTSLNTGDAFINAGTMYDNPELLAQYENALKSLGL